MVRKFLVPKHKNVRIEVPLSYVGKMLEIIAFEVEKSPSAIEITPCDSDESLWAFYNNINLDFSNYKFDRDEAMGR